MQSLAPVDEHASTLPPPPFGLKQCPCGATFTHEEWHELPYVGVWDLGDGERLELRNCPCGSTISVPL